MSRNIVPAIFLFILLTGCSGADFQELTCPLVWPGGPVAVKLPFEQTLNNGNIRLSIRPVPDRADAVQVIAKVRNGWHDLPVVEWLQEGCGMKTIALDEGGRTKYEFDFREFCPSGDAVGEVKMWVIYRAKL